MGRAARWLRSLLGGKKDTKGQKDDASTSGHDTRDRKRWSFAGPQQAASMGHSPVTAAWLSTFHDDSEEESKHAIAVAVATAAAASAAVTAAQAAMVRLKSLGTERTTPYGIYERWAAVKIQTAFRCYLVWINMVDFVKRSHLSIRAPHLILSSSYLNLDSPLFSLLFSLSLSPLLLFLIPVLCFNYGLLAQASGPISIWRSCCDAGKESSSSSQSAGEAAGSSQRLPCEEASSHNPPQTASSCKSSVCSQASRSSCSAPARSKTRRTSLPSQILRTTEILKH